MKSCARRRRLSGKIGSSSMCTVILGMLSVEATGGIGGKRAAGSGGVH